MKIVTVLPTICSLTFSDKCAYCKSLWIKASVNAVNVKVNGAEVRLESTVTITPMARG